MRQMKDSGIAWIGEIPAEWERTKIKYYYDCYDGKRVPVDSGERESGPYPYWGAGSITDYVNDFLFDEELILLGEDGAPFFDYTRPVAFLINEKVWVNNHIHVLKPKKNVSSKFLVHWLNSVDYKSYINGSILNKLTQSNMNNIAFVVPSLEEQNRIAEYLDIKCSRIDAVIEQTRASIEEYKKLKQAVITQAVTKGIRPNRQMKDSGIEWIGEIPEEWGVIPIKYLCSYNDEVLQESTDPDFSFDYIEIGSVEFGRGIIETQHIRFAEAPSRARRIVRENDIIVSTVRTYLKAVAPIPFTDTPLIASTGFVVIRPKDINPVFLRYAILSNAIISMIESNSVGISYPAINASQVVQFKIPVPKLEEQNTIADYLEEKCGEIDRLISVKQKLLDDLDVYKKTLVFEYVTGKKEGPA